jgi:DNA helicase IV
VTTAPSSEDPELQYEQEYLDRSHAALSAMHQRARALLDDLRQAGHPDLDYQAALMHRIAVLAESSRPLLFGRIDEEAGPSWHIGRRHVEDAEGDPVVIDWRAPVATPFYQARAEHSLGLIRRRQVMVERTRVMAVADDLFGGAGEDPSTTRLRDRKSTRLNSSHAITSRMPSSA